jgi:hypothetical protein
VSDSIPQQHRAFDDEPKTAFLQILERNALVGPELFDHQDGSNLGLNLTLFDAMNRLLREPGPVSELLLAEAEHGSRRAFRGPCCFIELLCKACRRLGRDKEQHSRQSSSDVPASWLSLPLYPRSTSVVLSPTLHPLMSNTCFPESAITLPHNRVAIAICI